MESVIMDAVQVQNLQGILAQNGQMAGAEGGLAGIFAELFAQLMGGMAEEGQNPEALLSGLLDMRGKKKEEDPNLLAMQLMAQSLFAPQAVDLSFLQQDSGQLAAVQDILTQQNPAPDVAALAAGMTQLQEAADGGQETRDTQWNELLETLTAAWETTDVTRADEPAPVTMMDQLRFQSAVREVRQTLADRPRTDEGTKQPLDIEALQNAVNTRQYITESVSTRQETPDIHEIAEQLKTGILDNVRQGKNEFVVKLKPAGLGEITVKFTESKNEIALRIITSSASVGKMIANDVNTLQNALRPLRAEVQEIVTVPSANESYAAGASLAGDKSQQQFAWHNEEQNAGHSRRRREENNEFEAVIEETAPDETGMNLLI